MVGNHPTDVGQSAVTDVFKDWRVIHARVEAHVISPLRAEAGQAVISAILAVADLGNGVGWSQMHERPTSPGPTGE